MVEKINGKGSGQSYTSQFALTAHRMYVQLKMVDNNGTVTYSNILPVNSNCAVNAVPLAYPNPVSSQLTLSNLGTENKNIQIIDLSGNVVYKAQVVSSQININTQSWSAGIYLVYIKSKNGSVITLKMMKR